MPVGSKAPSRGRSPTSGAVFALLCVMAFIMYVDRTNMAVVAPILKREIGLTNTELGYVFSAFAVAYSCFSIPGAWLSDRIGGRRGLTLFGILWSVATVATGVVGSLASLMAARFLVGVGEAPVYPTAARVIATWIPEHRRGAAQGMMHASGRLANALAPLIVTALVLAHSWRGAFVILGVVTAVFFTGLYAYLPDRKPSAGIAAVPAQPPVAWMDLLRRVWPATGACFCHGWVLWFFLNWVPSYFAIRYGMDIGKSALFSTLVLLGGTLGTLMGGVLADWHFKRTGDRLRSRRDIIIFGFLVSILGLVPLLLTDNLVVNAAGLGAAFFLSELADSPLWLVGVEVAPEHAGTSSALTFAGMALAGAISPVVTGALLDWTGGSFSAAFLASIAILLLGPAFAMMIRLDPALDARPNAPAPPVAVAVGEARAG